MSVVELRVPELGDFKDVTVVDVLAHAGQRVSVDDALITLETDKASMDVPATVAGVIERMHVAKGDKVTKGTLIATVRTEEIEKTTVVAVPESASDREQPYVETVTLADQMRVASRPQAKSAAPAAKPAAPAPSATPAAPTSPAAAPATKPAAPATPAPTPGARPAAPAAASSSTAPPPAPKPAASAPPSEAGTKPAERAGAPAYAFDVVVLGAGPGGYTAAFRAADLGQRVALIERSPTLGGVCLNVGCIPSKALLHAARVIEEAHSLSEHGLGFGVPNIDRAKLRNWKGQVVTRLTNGLTVLAKQRKVEVIQGIGNFVDANHIEVLQGTKRRVVDFKSCIIATGSESARLSGLPDEPRIIDSTGALELPDKVKRLLVVGGGIIGLEMACVYDALGAKVTVVELTDGLMPGCDRDLVRPLEKRIRSRYEQILLGTRVSKIEPLRNGLRVSFTGDKAPEPHLYDRVLVAIGRVPNGRNLGAERAGVNVDDRGFIRVDAQQRTNVANIFAIGDVVGPPMLAHKASHEGKVAAEVAAGQKRRFEARAIPSVAYTDPEIAWVGLTEIEAKQKGIEYGRGMFPWMASGRSLALNRDDGFTKILFDKSSHRVLGAGIVGTNAGELISEVALAIEMGCDAADIGLTIHPHPTLSETIAFAAEAYEGTLTDLYVPRK
jgi:dihydrolipoamide dehydrogenase